MATVEKTGNFRDPSAFQDFESTNNSPIIARAYSDLDLFLTRRSRDNDINVLTNVTAVKRSVRNLVLTNFYEKPFHPEIGSGVRDLLFELVTPLTSIAVKKAIEDVISNYEPRVSIDTISVRPLLDNNTYDVSIRFFILNGPSEAVDLSLTLEVLR